MAFHKALYPFLKSKRFWTDFFWITSASDRETSDSGSDAGDGYPTLAESGLGLRFGDGAQVAVSVDEALGYFSLRFSDARGAQWNREIAHDDQAHWIPHALRWFEVELLCEAAHHAEPEQIAHPGPALLFLCRFAPICLGDDVDHIVSLLDAAWRSLGAGFTDAEIRRMIERRDFRGARFRWFHDESRDYWWLGKGEDPDSPEAGDVYTQRGKKKTAFAKKPREGKTEKRGNENEEGEDETKKEIGLEKEKNNEDVDETFSGSEDENAESDSEAEMDEDDEDGFPAWAWNSVLAEAKKELAGLSSGVFHRQRSEGRDEDADEDAALGRYLNIESEDDHWSSEESEDDEDEDGIDYDASDEDDEERGPVEIPIFKPVELRQVPYTLRSHHRFELRLKLRDEERPLHRAAGCYFQLTLDNCLRILDLGSATSSGCSSVGIGGGKYVTEEDHISIGIWAAEGSDDVARGLRLLKRLLLWMSAPASCRVLTGGYDPVDGWSMAPAEDDDAADNVQCLGIAKPAELARCIWLVTPTIPDGSAELLRSAAVLGVCTATDPSADGWIIVSGPGSGEDNDGELGFNFSRLTDDLLEGVGVVALRKVTPAVMGVLHRFMCASGMTLLPVALSVEELDEGMASRWPDHRVVRTPEELYGILAGGVRQWWEGSKRPAETRAEVETETTAV